MAVAIDTNLLVALRAIDLVLTPTPSRDHMLLYCPVSILERYHNLVLYDLCSARSTDDQGAGFLIEVSSHQSQGFIECNQETR